MVPDRSPDIVPTGKPGDPAPAPAPDAAPTPKADTPAEDVETARAKGVSFWESVFKKLGWRLTKADDKTPDPDIDRWNDDGGP